MLAITPALWSAIAASFSALASVTVMLIQRANRAEAARPEIALTDWNRLTTRESTIERDVISFKTIRNVGKGTALHVSVHCWHVEENRPTAVLSTTRIPILTPGDSQDIHGEIVLLWQNVPLRDGQKNLSITLRVIAIDALSIMHTTQYQLLAVSIGTSHLSNCIAPGVTISSRSTSREPIWKRKLGLKVRQMARTIVRQPNRPRDPDASASRFV